MKPNPLYEKCQLADRMESVLTVASILGGIVAVLVLLTHGWLPGLFLFFVSLILYGLSRVFELLGGLLASMGRMEERMKSDGSKKDEGAV
jgi:hypothetical protein